MNQKTAENFRNEVMCRRGSNQHKARQLWIKIKPNISEAEATAFEIEWGHYMLGELDHDAFGAKILLVTNPGICDTCGGTGAIRDVTDLAKIGGIHKVDPWVDCPDC